MRQVRRLRKWWADAGDLQPGCRRNAAQTVLITAANGMATQGE